MQSIENDSKTGAIVHLDGKLFLNCVFTKCQVIYSGGDFGWRNTSFNDCQLNLEGPAQRTANLLQSFKLLNMDAFKKPTPPASPSTGTVQ